MEFLYTISSFFFSLSVQIKIETFPYNYFISIRVFHIVFIFLCVIINFFDSSWFTNKNCLFFPAFTKNIKFSTIFLFLSFSSTKARNAGLVSLTICEKLIRGMLCSECMREKMREKGKISLRLVSSTQLKECNYASDN